MESSSSVPSSAAFTQGRGPVPPPAGGLRLCFRHPGMLGRFLISRRFRHAVEARKHVWKIRCFQADELAPAAVAGIDQAIREFDVVLRSGPDRRALEEGLGRLDLAAQKWLRPYANASMRENVEVFLVAIAVAMAIRTFFLQPFKIPTGSMQPTLYGLHFEDLRDQPDVRIPGPLGRLASAVLRGEFYHQILAEADGEVIRIEPRRALALIGFQDVVVRYHEGGASREKSHRLWFSPVDGHGGDLQRGLRGVINAPDNGESFLPLRAGQRFRQGETLLRLKDATGDHLFVDRLTYNFRRPERGEIIVFETAGIRALPQDQFYIKRLVGLGGERLRLGDDRHLVVNGERLDVHTRRFEKVYGFEGPPMESRYSGHVNGTIAATTGRDPRVVQYFPNERQEYTIGDKRFMVMGDNTLNSYDSRGWGDFAQTNVVGKYCFVWWPFTERWGTRAR